MPRNQFKDEGSNYRCPRCMLGLHDMCSQPDICTCTHEFPAGKPEGEVPSQDDEPEWAVAEGLPPATFAELRKSHQSVTEAHRKTAT